LRDIPNIGEQFDMACIEFDFANVMKAAPALQVGQNRSRISTASKRIESARPVSGLSKHNKSRPVSALTTGFRGASSKITPIIIKTATVNFKGVAVFGDVPIGKYVVQFDGHSF